MVIIFKIDNDGVGVLYPTEEFLNSLGEEGEEEKLHFIANKDLPENTPYHIVQESEISSDREFRDAWEYEASGNDSVVVGVIKYMENKNAN